MTQNVSVAEKIENAARFLDDCEKYLDEGKIVKLEEFEKDIMKLCAKIQAGNPGENGVYVKALNMLIEKLDRLARIMQDRKKTIKEELENLTAGHKAATAYKKTPKSSNNNNG